jgi:uncharacterized protein
METPPAQKRERPRDELGRPLAWGAENRLVLEDYDNLSLDENHRLGIEHFNAGRYFPAHEAWESAWRLARGTADEEFFKGLAQLGAGYTHYLRGNPHGARVLIERGVGRIRSFGQTHLGIDIERLARASTAIAGAVGNAGRGSLPPVEFPKI